MALAASLVLLGGLVTMARAMGKGPEIPRMTKEELLPMLGNPDVVILDVRIGDEWKKSPWKIKGAVREDPEKGVQPVVEKYPKDKTYVLY
jgi:rhodanese-related sulfurtransferase